MRDIKINNKEVLDTLNWYSDWLVPKYNSGQMREDLPINCMDHTRDRWIADDYLERQIAKGRKHEGFPESTHLVDGFLGIIMQTHQVITYYFHGLRLVTVGLTIGISKRKNVFVFQMYKDGNVKWDTLEDMINQKESVGMPHQQIV